MQCSICLSDIESDGINKLFECDHVFHIECIHKWKGTCPNCRSERQSVPFISDDTIKAEFGIEFGDTLEIKFTDVTCTYFGKFKYIYRYGDKMFIHIDKFRIFTSKNEELQPAMACWNVLIHDIGSNIKSIRAIV